MIEYIQIMLKCAKKLKITELIFNNFSGTMLSKCFKEDKSEIFKIIHFLRLENIKLDEKDLKILSQIEFNQLHSNETKQRTSKESKSTLPKVISPSKPTGLPNIRNTCYMNSAIQCLLAAPLVSKILTSELKTKT